MRIYEPMCGTSIDHAAKQMVALAKETKGPVKAKFNDIELTVKPGATPASVANYYRRESDRRYKRYLKSPEYKEDKKRQEERRRQERFKMIAVEIKLLNAPAIELADEAGWQTFEAVNRDGYGGAVVTYSERWARLMQVEMANGKKLEDVADAASHEADLEGITGFMYGCAVYILSKVWIHGETLRRWHNLKTQIGNEGEKANENGGTLNPAILCIAPK